MTSPRLPRPLKDVLSETNDEAALQRMWQRIDARAAHAVVGTSSAGTPRRLRPSWPGIAAGLAAAAALVIVWAHGRDPGPLLRVDGSALAAVVAPAEGVSLPLSDGSTISLAAGARFTALESTGTSFLAVLQSGRGEFDIKPGGPRRWQIECGLATVEVLGTRFTCERAEGALDVSVSRGVVLVRGEKVPDRVRRLSAGQSLHLESAAREGRVVPASASVSQAAGVSQATPSVVSQPLPEAAPLAPPLSPGPRRAGERWRELARHGKHQEAFAVLGTQGVRRETRALGVDGLLSLADVARLSGHPRDALAPLERILHDFPSDPQAPLAAIELGRVELDALGRAMPAIVAFERALSLGVPATLKEDVEVRLVEAYLKAGDRERAVSLGNTYLRTHPTGRYRRTIEARLQLTP